MKKLLLASLAGLILTTGSAFAADLATPAPVYKAPPPPPPVASWTGCYIDGGAGYGLFNQDHSTTFTGGVVSVITTDGGRGWLGRFGGGCDYQTPLFDNRLVVGVFGDYDFMSLTGSNTPDVINGATGSPSTFPTKETDAAYAGGRIGYLVNPALLTYVDGGWTTTHFANSPVITTGFGNVTGTSWPSYSPQGWFLGGGYEYALNSDWLPIHGLFWRTEYRFSQYNSSDIRIITAAGAPGGDVEHITPYVQTITSSLVWRFNFGGPIATAESGPALAYKAPPAPPPAMGWTGCYIDAGGVYGLMNQDHSTTGPGFATVSTTDAGRGWLGRVGGGCDYQTPLFNNRVTVGVFGDNDFMSLNGTNTPQLVNSAGGVIMGTVTFNTTENNAAYVGGRVGYLVNPTLLTYADGGWTATHFSNSPEIRTPSGTPSGFAWPSYSPQGWFIGGGAEYALSSIVPINGLFWRSEYRLASYNKTDVAQFIVASGAPNGNVEHITPYVQTVASGLVWRFNFGGPIATRY